jgi:hypothetical protein
MSGSTMALRRGPVNSRRWRRLLRLALLFLATLAFGVAVAVLLIYHVGSVNEATKAFKVLRPAMIVVQIAALAALWFYWAPIVAWIARRRRWPLDQEVALIRARPRLMLLFVAFELLIVARALVL